MISAIIYTSLTGSCEKYAKLLSAALHVPAKPMGEFVRSDSQVIFVGWAFAGKVHGYSKARKMYNIVAVVNVGMNGAATGAAETARQASSIPGCVEVFSVQGGYCSEKLPAPFRLIMNIKCRDIVKRLTGKARLSESEQALMVMASTGCGEPASWDVGEIVAWAKAYKA